MKHEEARALIDQQFEAGPLEPPQMRELRAHLRECSDCKAHYDRSVRVEEALEGARPAVHGQVARMVKEGPDLRAKATPSLFRFQWIPIATSLALAAGLALFFLKPRDLAPRGGSVKGKHAWFRAFYVHNERVKPVEGRLPAPDGLLFAYSNVSESPFRYMVIVGLDAAGRAHWYHPAYERPEDQPTSVKIQAGGPEKELAERIYTEHAQGPLQICAIFTKMPLAVRDLDQKIESTRAFPKVEHGEIDCIQTKVVP